MCIGGFAAALAFALLPRRVAGVALPAGVALVLVVFSYSVYGSIRDHAVATLGLTSPADPSWIDDQIGPRSKAAYIYGATAEPFGEAQVMWQTEFWNRSVDTVYTLGPADPGLTARPATLNAVTGRIVPQPGAGSEFNDDPLRRRSDNRAPGGQAACPAVTAGALSDRPANAAGDPPRRGLSGQLDGRIRRADVLRDTKPPRPTRRSRHARKRGAGQAHPDE